jgi:hypothetical protein
MTAFTASISSVFLAGGVNAHFSLPTFSCNSRCSWQIRLISSCARSIPSSSVASGI